ncbi:MAG: DUF448 domain-containing protein [Sulfurovum sp.]|nr:DUF448 domain-containing protein [Sulfurovum sp.]MCB4744462.1 DUF448 domain-containing protein [Sulfurovum sp.]MCB4745922.1 DUF448 domain-containing protein [Sulfurovum sp.]MCB4748989.1 DUF448 domain-containing protein [Sulfurovum sp.]MCB4752818.1 DUF448 domain-containing protein [Sulfurovum sp.]
MCIACRSRYPQHTLIRLKQEGNDVIAYNGYGRSFYLCNTCINNTKRVKGLMKRFKLNEEHFVKLLIEVAQQVSPCDMSHSNEGVNK